MRAIYLLSFAITNLIASICNATFTSPLAMPSPVVVGGSLVISTTHPGDGTYVTKVGTDVISSYQISSGALTTPATVTSGRYSTLCQPGSTTTLTLTVSNMVSSDNGVTVTFENGAQSTTHTVEKVQDCPDASSIGGIETNCTNCPSGNTFNCVASCVCVEEKNENAVNVTCMNDATWKIDTECEKGGVNIGAIIGITTGVGVMLIAVTVSSVKQYKRKKCARRNQQTSKSSS